MGKDVTMLEIKQHSKLGFLSYPVGYWLYVIGYVTICPSNDVEVLSWK